MRNEANLRNEAKCAERSQFCDRLLPGRGVVSMLRFVPALANFLTRLPKFLSGFFRALLDFLRSPICFSTYLACSGLIPVSIAVARREYQPDRNYESHSASAHLRSFPSVS